MLNVVVRMFTSACSMILSKIYIFVIFKSLKQFDTRTHIDDSDGPSRSSKLATARVSVPTQKFGRTASSCTLTCYDLELSRKNKNNTKLVKINPVGTARLPT